ncbi:MAG: hypothetical protein OEM82_15830, partial [Acidobacteriota bacterium]|nr:hypothetical protein [Acidobacteriota bacterium]
SRLTRFWQDPDRPVTPFPVAAHLLGSCRETNKMNARILPAPITCDKKTDIRQGDRAGSPADRAYFKVVRIIRQQG